MNNGINLLFKDVDNIVIFPGAKNARLEAIKADIKMPKVELNVLECISIFIIKYITIIGTKKPNALNKAIAWVINGGI